MGLDPAVNLVHFQMLISRSKIYDFKLLFFKLSIEARLDVKEMNYIHKLLMNSVSKGKKKTLKISFYHSLQREVIQVLLKSISNVIPSLYKI